MNRRSKREWTLEMMEQASLSQPHLVELSKSYVLFWFNLAEDRGFRLTERGCDLLVARGYECHHFALTREEINRGRILVLMDQRVQEPWYAKNGKLWIFGQDLSLGLSMCGNDLEQAIQLIYS
jgi:hypothetical protein